MIKRYMKNTETGVVMPLELPLLNKYQNLVECDENGNVLGKANIDSGDLINRNATLQNRIDSLLDQLKSKELTISKLTAEIDLLKQQGKTPEIQKTDRIEELSQMKKAELVAIAEALNVPTAGKKVQELIELIIDAETENADTGEAAE